MILTPETAVLASRYFLGASIAVSALELLAEPKLTAPAGLLGWPLLVTAHSRARQPFEAIRNACFSQQGMRAMHSAAFLLACALVLPWHGTYVVGAICLALLALHAALSYRSIYGGDGSDQMSNVVLAGLAFQSFAPHSGPVVLQHAGFWFIAIQCALSYCVAGIAKAVSPMWRSGAAPRAILSSSSYGSPLGVRMMDAFPRGSFVLAWLTIVIECAYPLVLFAPAPVVVFLLVMGILFHLGNAVFMGLNTFLTAFAAAYPIVLLMNPHFR